MEEQKLKYTNYNEHVLKGLHVIELASVLAGPLVGSFLAELGAFVIKIENATTNGDVTRQWKNSKESSQGTNSAYYHAANKGKEVLFLDFTNPKDHEILHNLLAKADVITSNLQKRVSQKYGIDPYTLHQKYPKVIFAQLDAYTYDDPRPGYDMVMQAETGFIGMTGSSDGQLAKIPVALMDVLAGHHMKESILCALLRKQITGEGCITFTSLYKSALTGLVNQASNYLNQGLVARPMGTLHPNIAPYGEIITTKDDKQLLLAIGSDAQFVKLCNVLQLSKNIQDQYLTNSQRLKNRNELYNLINQAASQIGYSQLKALFEHEGIPYGEILKINEVFRNQIAQEMIYIDNEGNQSLAHLAFEINICPL